MADQVAIALLAVLAAVDLRTGRIPRWLTVPAALIALLLAPDRLESVTAGLSAFAVGWLAWWIGRRRYPARVAFGRGDVALVGVVGLVCGWPGWIWALAIGGVAGGPAAVGLLIAGRSREATFPYGPCLAAGGIAVIASRM